MKSISSSRAIIICLLLAAPAFSDPLILAEAGQSSYHIVVAADASMQDFHAAEVLGRYVKEMAGAELQIVSDDNALGEHEIIIGFNRHTDHVAPALRAEAFGPEAFRIRSVGKHLLIVGGAPRGVLYGVNSLLTDEFGCRWFTPTLRRIPTYETLLLPPTDRRYEPHFEWRYAFFASGIDNEWSFHNFQNKSRAHLRPEQGWRGGFVWRQHTAMQMVPPEIYQVDHPQYYWTGKGDQPRLHGKGTLGICLTHPDIPRIAAESIRRARRQHPGGDLYYCLSSMDGPDWCECDRCEAWHKRQRQQAAANITGPAMATFPLSNEWRFAPDAENVGDDERWYADDVNDDDWPTVRSDLGTGWEHQIEGYKEGHGWYRQRWIVPAEVAKKKHRYLFFAAVDEEAWVYVNGRLIFEHSIASTGLSPDELWMKPFSVDVSDAIKPGRANTIAVRVFNESGMGGVYKPVHLVAGNSPIDIEVMRIRLGAPTSGFEWRHGGLWLDLAARVQAEFKDDPDPPRLSVMAYGWTGQPPINPKMHKGLNLFYADLTMPQVGSFSDPDNPYSRSYRQHVEGWRKCTDSMYVWLYNVNFTSWAWPHPNMHALAENFRYLRKVGVRGVFAQGNQMEYHGRAYDGEMNELRAYLIARLLWNPDLDWRQERRDFCDAYFGPAAGRAVEFYLDDLHAAFVEHGSEFTTNVNGPDTFRWITPETFARWYALIDKAESLAADEEYRKRVRIARLPIEFAEGSIEADPARRKALLQTYYDHARELGASHLIGEGDTYGNWASQLGLK